MTRERIGSLLVWPEEGPLWRYLPLAPVPQRNEAGRANVTVMEAGGMVMLTIGARLEPTAADLAEARKVIARRAGLAEAAVDLRPAGALVEAASLRLVAADGGETELARARPSDLPPWPAAFSAMLQGDQAKAVKAALPEGRVVVRYELALPFRREARAELAGSWDGTGAVEAALSRGDLRLRTQADDGASEALVKRAVAKAMSEAATPLPGATGACAARQATFVEAVETEAASDRMVLDAKINDWIN